MIRFFILTFLSFSYLLTAQVVTTDPALPTADEAVTLYFHADEGTGGLADYTGDIYAHIGVITTESDDDTDWKYVKATWAENIPACKMTKVSANLYSLTLATDLYTYFESPTTEKILKIAMVFRSSTGSPEGKDTGGSDIFVNVYEAGLNISFERTANYLLVDPDSTVSFSANASLEADLEISVNGISKKTVADSKLITHSETFATAADYWVVAKASVGTQTVLDSIFVCAIGTPTTATMPSGFEDGINYNSNTSVTFVLLAPYKDNVVMIGDFNNWVPSNEYLLKKDGERWWITIDGLNAGEEYAYQYLVDKTIAIADPYAEKILDPWNDKYISSTTYPNLKEYPSGKVNDIVGVIEPGAEDYQWDVTDFTPPANEKLVVYELLVRDFVSSQDIKDVIKKLDYLDELGITAIELMPVNEFEGNNSWGYNPSFYCAFDKNYGTKNDYKTFIDSCHARGIAVIMDIALNHAYFQCPLVDLYFDADAGDYGQPSAENPWFNETSPNTEYSWGADFNHESEYTEAFVDRVVAHWMTEFKVDGFRFDFTKGFTNTAGSGWNYDQSRIDNLKRIYDKLQVVNPDTYNYMIIEHFCAASEETELANYGMIIWGNNNNAYMQCAMGYSTDASIVNISHTTKGWTYPNLMAYQESHDEERMMYKALMYGNANTDNSYNVKDTATALDRIELNAAFFLTVPGPKMIWQFGELGYNYSIDYNDRVGEKPVRWDFFEDQDRRDVYDVYAKINQLRAKYPVFSSSDFTISELSYFTKRININDASANVAIIGNFDVDAQWVEPNFSTTGTWYEFFSGDEINVTSTDMGIELQPGEYKLYSSVILTVDDVDPELLVLEQKDSKILIYPNPAADVINIENDKTIVSVRLYNIQGQIIKQKSSFSNAVQLTVSDVPVGTYLLQVNGDDYSSFSRVMIK